MTQPVTYDAMVYISFVGFGVGYNIEAMDTAARWQEFEVDTKSDAYAVALVFLWEELNRWEDQPCLAS